METKSISALFNTNTIYNKLSGLTETTFVVYTTNTNKKENYRDRKFHIFFQELPNGFVMLTW